MEILKRYELLAKYKISTSMICPLMNDGYIERVKGKGYKLLKPLDIVEYRKQRAEKTNKKIANTLIKFFSHQENRNAQSDRLKNYRSRMTEDQKIAESAKFSKIMTIVMSQETARSNVSKGMIKYYEENPEAHERVANNNRKNWQNPEFGQKRKATMKKNGTSTSSSWAEQDRQYLRNLGFTVEEEKPYPEEYKLHCDAYIKELDLWIEFHYCPYHNYKPFNETNEEHLKELKRLKEQAKISSWHNSIVYHWTNSDVRRKLCASKHNLSWIAFYNRQDFYNFINSKIRKDV